MLLENFYKIIHRKEREDGKREIEIELNPVMLSYQDIFPDSRWFRASVPYR